MSKIRFSRAYAGWALAILAIETCIALFLDDDLIRPYVGDTLAVILVYVAVLSALDLPRARTALGAFGFACLVELGQYFRMVDHFGLAHIPAARVILGTNCDPHDFIAYAFAVPVICVAEVFATSRARAASTLRPTSSP